MTPELQAVSDRLERVERENRRLKRVGIGVLLAACAGLLMGQVRPRRAIEAEKFVVKNSAGGMSIELSAGPGYAAEIVYDKAGLKRFALDLDSHDTCIKLWDSATKHLGESGVKLCQTTSGPFIELTDKQDKVLRLAP